MRNASIVIIFLLMCLSVAMAFHRAFQKDFAFAFLWMATAFIDVGSILVLVL